MGGFDRGFVTGPTFATDRGTNGAHEKSNLSPNDSILLQSPEVVCCCKGAIDEIAKFLFCKAKLSLDLTQDWVPKRPIAATSGELCKDRLREAIMGIHVEVVVPLSLVQFETFPLEGTSKILSRSGHLKLDDSQCEFVHTKRFGTQFRKRHRIKRGSNVSALLD